MKAKIIWVQHVRQCLLPFLHQDLFPLVLGYANFLTGIRVQSLHGFDYPTGLFANEGHLYVTDRQGVHRLRKVTSRGRCLGEVEQEEPPTGGSDLVNVFINSQEVIAIGNKEPRLRGLGLDFRLAWSCPLGPQMLKQASCLRVSGDEIYVMDMDYCGIFVFERHSHSFLRFLGSRGSGPGQFELPMGIAIGEARDTPKGEIFVADAGNFRIQVIDAATGYPRRCYHGGDQDCRFLGVALYGDQMITIAHCHDFFLMVLDRDNDEIQKRERLPPLLSRGGRFRPVEILVQDDVLYTTEVNSVIVWE